MKHEQYIKRCLEIAKLGIGTARPNPSVGAVLVVDNKIIGEGFTSPYGGSHAEVNAIECVKDRELLKQATIYVTLEPCSHFGKTPPCSDLIFNSEIKKVVIGCVDSNSLVSGKGIERLKNAGCEVIVGVLEKECKEHAILVGTTTVLEDNPTLNVRDWKGENPVRIVIDKGLKIPTNLNIYDTSIKTIFITEKESNNRKNISFNILFT